MNRANIDTKLLLSKMHGILKSGKCIQKSIIIKALVLGVTYLKTLNKISNPYCAVSAP